MTAGGKTRSLKAFKVTKKSAADGQAGMKFFCHVSLAHKHHD